MNNNNPIAIPPLTKNSHIRGIVENSFVIRTALIAGLADVKANPELLNYVFARMIEDELTQDNIRLDIMRTFTEWVINADIKVVLYPKLDNISFPMISININDSTEGENTLGDVHYVASEKGDSPQGFTIGPFVPTGYNVLTGELTLPVEAASLYTTTRMGLNDSFGTEIPFVKSGFGVNVWIPPDINPNRLTSVYVKTLSPNAATKIESVDFSEKYSIGCHAQGEPSYTLYLHALTLFILLRYRETLLERRGFERSQISNSPLTVMQNLRDGMENAFSRYITLTGHARYSWPKYSHVLIDSVSLSINAEVIGNTPSTDQSSNDKGFSLWSSK